MRSGTSASTRVRRMAAILCLAISATALAGCSTTGSTSPTTTPTVSKIAEAKGVVFSRPDGNRLTLDACTPKNAKKAPIVVLVHGGGFTNGRPSDLDFVCTAAAQQGYAAFSISYRLLPARYPAQLVDVSAAVEWLTRPAQVARFHTDPDDIGMIGASAGATIVAQLATQTPGSPARPKHLKAVALLSGVYAPIALTSALKDVETQYLGCDVTTAACAERARTIYAANYVDRDDPPMLVMNSTKELAPLPQAERFAKELAAHRVPHRLVVTPGDAHAEAVLVTNAKAPAQLLAFLDRYLR